MNTLVSILVALVLQALSGTNPLEEKEAYSKNEKKCMQIESIILNPAYVISKEQLQLQLKNKAVQ